MLPFQPLGSVQGRQGDGAQCRLVLGLRAGLKLVGECPQGRSGRRLLCEAEDRRPRLPCVAQCAARLGWIVGEPERAQHVADGIDQPVQHGSDGCPSQRHQRLPHLGDIEEPSPSDDGCGDSAIGEGTDQLG